METLSTNGLQYWHAELNRLFFKNELEPAIVILKESDDYDLTAHFDENLDPYLIEFYKRPFMTEKDYFSENQPIDLLTILLHEMVHQYCNQTGLYDIEETGEHTEEFREEAEAHGLKNGGYVLTPAAEKIILERLESYFVISSL